MGIDITKDQAQSLVRHLQRDGVLDKNFHVENPPAWPFEKGKTYLIRAIPLYYIGEVVRWTDKVVILRNAAWVRDTGDYHQVWFDSSGLDTRRYPKDLEVPVVLDGISDCPEYPCDWPEGDR